MYGNIVTHIDSTRFGSSC